jgi:hypothetical protein
MPPAYHHTTFFSFTILPAGSEYQSKPPNFACMNALQKELTAGLKDAMGYQQYLKLIEQLHETNSTTGINQSELYVNFSKLNYRRMKRVYKTFSINADLAQVIEQLPPSTWVVITEAWCGDAAQTVPLMARLAELNPAIDLKLLLRDSHDSIMNEYLTNGGKAIPILVGFNAQYEQLFVWGPRPQPAQQMVRDYKALSEPKPDYLTFAESVQKWYTADAGFTFSEEMTALLSPLVSP